MERSDDYIDFNAYVKYLKKVTGEPADPESLRKAILVKTAESTELQIVYRILTRLIVAAVVLLFIALLAVSFVKCYQKFSCADRCGEELSVMMRMCGENEGGQSNGVMVGPDKA